MAAGLRRPGRDGHHGGHTGCRAPRRLRAEAQLVRPQRRHRAVRHRAAPALRAPRGEGGGGHGWDRQGVLCRGQHPDAGDVDTWTQGQLLQVHERDPQRHRGRIGQLGPGVDSGGERNRRRRWIRAGAGMRRDLVDRRQCLCRFVAGDPPPRRAPRHRRPHSPGRQALRPPGPRRRVRHSHRGDQGTASGRLAPGRCHRTPKRIRRSRRGPGVGSRRRIASTGRRRRDCPPVGRRLRRDHRRHASIHVRRRRHRPRTGLCPIPRSGPAPDRGDHGRRTGCRGSRRMAAARGIGARPCHLAPAIQRAVDRHVDLHERRQPRRRRSGRGGVHSGSRSLARPRDPAAVDPHAQAARRVSPLAHCADRARQLLRGSACRDGAGCRPVADPRWRPAGRRGCRP